MKWNIKDDLMEILSKLKETFKQNRNLFFSYFGFLNLDFFWLWN